MARTQGLAGRGAPRVGNNPDRDLVALDHALSTLSSGGSPEELRSSRCDSLAGWSVGETARELQVSPDTVMRDWRLAKVWLLRELGPPERDDE